MCFALKSQSKTTVQHGETCYTTEFFSVVLCVTSVFVLVLGGLCSVLFILLKYGFYERMLQQLTVIMALCPIIFALDYEIVDHY